MNEGERAQTTAPISVNAAPRALWALSSAPGSLLGPRDPHFVLMRSPARPRRAPPSTRQGCEWCEWCEWCVARVARVCGARVASGAWRERRAWREWRVACVVRVARGATGARGASCVASHGARARARVVEVVDGARVGACPTHTLAARCSRGARRARDASRAWSKWRVWRRKCGARRGESVRERVARFARVARVACVGWLRRGSEGGLNQVQTVSERKCIHQASIATAKTR